MSARISIAKTGIVLGALLGGWHLCWSVLVAIGWAQPIIDFVFWLHFIKPVYVIERFELARAALLVAVTAGIGFILGAAAAAVWNVLHKA